MRALLMQSYFFYFLSYFIHLANNVVRIFLSCKNIVNLSTLQVNRVQKLRSPIFFMKKTTFLLLKSLVSSRKPRYL